MRPCLLVLPLLLLAACKPPEESHAKAILGAVMIDGAGGPPVSNSVVTVSGSEIREAGASSTIPIPGDADKIDGSGRYLVPGLVDVCPQAQPPAEIHAATPDQAREEVAAQVKAKASVIYIGNIPPGASQAALEAARDAHLPALARASTQAEAKSLVAQGASAILGMIRDTEDLDSSFVARLRDLRIVFVPMLSTLPAGPELEIARRNTRRLFAAGVPIAAGSGGGDLVREAEALSGAGIPPLDVIVAATRNSAFALHQSDRQGTIQPGQIADLLLLSANPGDDVRNLRRVAGRMNAGEWSQK